MLTLNPLLQNQAVLQAGKINFLNGMTHPNIKVFLTINKRTFTTKSDPSGEFLFEVAPQEHAKNISLEFFTEKESKKLLVHYGDVFLFAGQSNMEYPMKQEVHFKEEKANIDLANIFFYTVPRPEFELKNDDYQEVWQKLTAENLGTLSAVAYYTLKEYQRNNPDNMIGAVVCSKGGTSAKCWISENVLHADSVLNDKILIPFHQAAFGRSKESFMEEFGAYIKQYEEYADKRSMWVEEHPEMSLGEIKEVIGHSPWPPPESPYLFTRPSGLYKTMFKPIMPFIFAGVIWYQGEEDTSIADLYERLLENLIVNWRTDFGSDVPFYIVQLPVCRDRPIHDWATLRAAQLAITQRISNTFLITSLDCGTVDDIHPPEKSVLGNRIGEILAQKYYVSAPIARVKHWRENQLTLEIQQATEVVLKDNVQFEALMPITSIETNGNELTIKTELPLKKISYSWENAPSVTIFNEVGYPVSPFRFERSF